MVRALPVVLRSVVGQLQINFVSPECPPHSDECVVISNGKGISLARREGHRTTNSQLQYVSLKLCGGQLCLLSHLVSQSQKLNKRNGSIMRKLFNDEAGFIISAELVLVLTIAVLGMVVGLVSVRDSLLNEMCDISSAFGAVNQSFDFRGASKEASGAKGHHAIVAGAGFADTTDDCDCKIVTYSDVCGKPDASGGTVAEGNLP